VASIEFPDLMPTKTQVEQASNVAAVVKKARDGLLAGLSNGQLMQALGSVSKDNSRPVTNQSAWTVSAATDFSVQNELLASNIVGDLMADGVEATIKTEAGTEEIRARARQSLIHAAEANTLDELARADVEESRTRMRQALTQAAEAGILEDAIKSKNLSGEVLEERRGRVAEALQTGLESGSLERALAEDDLEDIRARTAAVLFGGMSTGQLEQAIATVKGEQIQEDVNDGLRARTANLLVDACTTGRLDVAFAAASEESHKHRAKLHARQALEAALLEDLDAGAAREKARDALETLLLDEPTSAAEQAKARQRARAALEAALDMDVDTAMAQAKAREALESLLLDEPMSAAEQAMARQKTQEALEAALDAMEAGDDKREAARRSAQQAVEALMLDSLDEEDAVVAREKARTALEALMFDEDTPASREDARQKARDALEALLDNAEVGENVDSDEAARENARSTLESVLFDGPPSDERERVERQKARDALETLLDTEAMDSEEPRRKAREALEATLLENASTPAEEARAREQARVALEVAMSMETDTSLQPPPVKVPGPSTMLALLDALSIRDRKIGALFAKVQVAKQRIAEREEACRVIEEEVAQSVIRGNHLDLDIEWHTQALQGAEKRNEELEATQRSLFNAHDPFRRKALDVRAGDYASMLSPRSTDLSTAAGFSEDRFSTFAGWSPRTPRRHLLQPLAPNLS